MLSGKASMKDIQKTIFDELNALFWLHLKNFSKSYVLPEIVSQLENIKKLMKENMFYEDHWTFEFTMCKTKTSEECVNAVFEHYFEMLKKQMEEFIANGFSFDEKSGSKMINEGYNGNQKKHRIAGNGTMSERHHRGPKAHGGVAFAQAKQKTEKAVSADQLAELAKKNTAKFAKDHAKKAQKKENAHQAKTHSKHNSQWTSNLPNGPK